jgi:hypothetical protein
MEDTQSHPLANLILRLYNHTGTILSQVLQNYKDCTHCSHVQIIKQARLTYMTGIPEQLSQDQNTNDPKTVLTLVMITILGGFIRLVHVVGLDFPLNDGGFFYQSILDLQRASYTLPEFASYNLRWIPFAYPPLAFYMSSALSDGFGWPVLGIIRLLPAVISILTIPAFILLCHRILRSSNQVIFATFAFAFLPTSFDWLIVGGGLTRSFGYLFAILTLWQVYALFTSEKRQHILLTALFGSLTILSHPGTTWFAVYSSAVMMAFNIKNNPRWWLKSILVGLGVIILTSPWWLTVVSRHGLGVLTSPFQTEGPSIVSILTPISFLFTNEPLLDILALSGLLGVFISLKYKSYFYPVWLFSVFLFESRLSATYSVVPMALLAGIGIDRGIRPLLSSESKGEKGKLSGLLPTIAIVYFGLYAIINAYLGINYETITQEQISTMTWIKTNTPVDSKFLVLTGTQEYGKDQVSEWFPALSQRTSLTTPQGHEWLPDKEFFQRVKLHAELQSTFQTCDCHELACIDEWATERAILFSHIYLPDSFTYELSTESNPNYEVLYDGPGGMVITRK